MAVKWAVANGNWSAGTTWNNGVVPAVGDYVYLDNHNVTLDIDVVLGNGFISNDTNPTTGLSGGIISYTGTHTITANIVCRYANMFTQLTQSSNITIIGNIVGLGGADENIFYGQIWGLTTTIVINGNVDAYVMNVFAKVSDASNMTYFVVNGNVVARSVVKTAIGFGLIINGNADLNSIKSVPTGNHIGNIQITGSLHISVDDNVNNISVGSLKCSDCTLVATNLSVGKIEYSSTTNSVGVRYTTLNVLNPDTFTWKDVTEPRSNPFIILTDAEMNNRQQYPPEDEVKEGTEYVWGEKVGTYEAPPEAVVLKDYEYDTITAEENDIATYNLTRYIYADYGTLHWFELKTTTTDIVTTPSQQSISIDGETVVADTDYVVEYDDACYQWSGSAWGSITTKNIGTVKTDIVTNPTEATLCAKKGSLEVVNLPQTTLDRMANALTIDIFQQILDAHLNN